MDCIVCVCVLECMCRITRGRCKYLRMFRGNAEMSAPRAKPEVQTSKHFRETSEAMASPRVILACLAGTRFKGDDEGVNTQAASRLASKHALQATSTAVGRSGVAGNGPAAAMSVTPLLDATCHRAMESFSERTGGQPAGDGPPAPVRCEVPADTTAD